MTLEDQTSIEAPPERVFAFFEHMGENYLALHSDHITFRWMKGQGVEPGAEFYFEETVGGQLLKQTMRFTRVETFRYIEFEPAWWLMRLFLPRFSFEIVPREKGSLFIAKVSVRKGPVGAWLLRREFEAVRQHMQEEGQNLKRILEQDKAESERNDPRGV